jgi:cytochrome c6
MSNISTRPLWILLFFSAACSSSVDDKARSAASINPGAALVPDGMAIFRQKCVTCHGADGTLGLNGAKDLSQSILPLEERINRITHGKNLMTPFATILSPEEIKAVADYTLTLKK